MSERHVLSRVGNRGPSNHLGEKGGGGGVNHKTEKIPQNQIFKVSCGFVFFSTLFRENVANLTNFYCGL